MLRWKGVLKLFTTIFFVKLEVELSAKSERGRILIEKKGYKL